MSKKKYDDWHRYLGLLLADFFAGTDYSVEIELDLSIKKQLLDVAVIRRGNGELKFPLPDGMEELAAHNLITFKSHHYSLADYDLKELTAHYINYRKQVSPDMQHLLPESDFRLFGICTRKPETLASEVTLTQLRPGVYDCQRGTDLIRIICIGELPEQEPNAMLHLLGASEQKFRYGVAHYHQRCPDGSTLIQRLMGRFSEEGFPMPYTMEDLKREIRAEALSELTFEERLEGIPSEERIKGLPPEERFKGLLPEECIRGLSPEQLDGIKQYLEKPADSSESDPTS